MRRLIFSCSIITLVVAVVVVLALSSSSSSKHEQNEEEEMIFRVHKKEARKEEERKRTDDAKYRIAIIGGGIGGTFVSKFLSKYDSSACRISEMVLFDPYVNLDGNSSGSVEEIKRENESWRQGPRIHSISLDDNRNVVELGASIFYEGNRLVAEVVDANPNLTKVDPSLYNDSCTFPSTTTTTTTTTNQQGCKEYHNGIGIYDGNHKWSVLTTKSPSWWNSAMALYRYGLDLWKMQNAAKKAVSKFNLIYHLLDDKSSSSFFHSPDDLWKSVGLYETTTMSFDAYLDSIGISKLKTKQTAFNFWTYDYLAYFLQTMAFQCSAGISYFLSQWSVLRLGVSGAFRTEALSGINFDNYNQPNSQLSGLAGLVSFLPTQGQIYKVKEGNSQILSSAFRTAQENHLSSCGESSATTTVGPSYRIHHVRKVVTSVIYTDQHMELWSDDNKSLLGTFDVVVLAAPIQHSRISFLKRQKKYNKEELMPMNFNGGGGERDILPSLPSSATRKYTQTITTMVQNATLQPHYLGISKQKQLPGSILVTERGRQMEGFSAISELIGDSGTYKVFSSQTLSNETLTNLFGPYHHVVTVKTWGGPYGGAYPDFHGGGEFCRPSPFLLFDGRSSSTDVSGNMTEFSSKQQERRQQQQVLGASVGPALYGVNAMESAVSAMEISAIGGKAVSKLIAKRLGLIP